MAEKPTVGIVTLNWNTYTETSECLKSLNEVEYDNMFVVVVDNGSTDGSDEDLSEEFGWCDFIFNETNEGFAKGSNIGIEHALEKGADYVLLINNDITVSSDFLQPLVETGERHDRVAIVGGLIYGQSEDDIWHLGGEINPFLADISEDHNATKNEEFETGFVTCALALLSEDFLQNNKLDKNYFFGVEEIDLSWRALENNWKIFTNPKSEVYHDDAASTEHMYEGDQLFSPFQKYHNTRGRLYFSHKNTDLFESTSYYLLSITFFPLYYIFIGIRYGRWDILHAHLLAIYDYILNNPIKKPAYFD